MFLFIVKVYTIIHVVIVPPWLMWTGYMSTVQRNGDLHCMAINKRSVRDNRSRL